MSEYRQIPTTPEVWAVIRASHPKMQVFSSYSDPGGRAFGGSGETGRMETAYGFEGQDFPTLAARTTWEIDPKQPYTRINETHEYWLCVGRQESDT
jgi:hypothetical protein